MKLKKRFFSYILFSLYFQFGFTQATNNLPLSGLTANNQGLIAWNESPNNVGHPIVPPYNAFSNNVAYYFIASSDYLNFNPASTTGMHGVNNLTGFNKLAAALVFHNKTIADINVQFDVSSLGADEKGVGKDWNHIGSLETREYTGGAFRIRLGNENLISGRMPTSYLKIEYNSAATPFDDVISSVTDYASPVKAVELGATNAANDIADAFLQDISNHGIRFNFSSVQPAGQSEYRSGNIIGGFFNIDLGVIETGSMTIPFLGDTINFCDGDSVLLDAGSGRTGYLWSNGATTQTIKVHQSGSYYVQIDSSGIKANSLSVQLNMNSSKASTQSITVQDSAVINGNTYTTTQVIVDTLKTMRGCDSIVTTNLTISLPTGIEANSIAEANIKVLPNPFTAELYLDYNLDEVSDVTIQLFNAMGDKVFESNTNQQAIGKHQFNLAGLAKTAGVYNLILTLNNDRFATRVVKL